MNNLTRKRVALFAVAGMIVGFIAYRALDPNEPRYQGRRITEWLHDYSAPRPPFLEPSNARLEAEKALQEIGPKAAPYIIRRLKADDSLWNRQYRTLFAKLPSWVRKVLRAPGEPFTEREGSAAFLAIGPTVKPELARALTDDSPLVRAAAAQALWRLFPTEGEGD
jgi:HEAT repeat protein